MRKATSDDYSSDALQYLNTASRDLNDPRAEMMIGLGYALLAIDSRLREVVTLLDDRM